MQYFSERQTQILEALWTFQYLTTKQIAKIQRVKHPHYINRVIKKLSSGKKPLLGSRGMGIAPAHGKLWNVHYLTQYGMEFVRDELGNYEEDIKYVRSRGNIFERDYFHRIYTIDFFIAYYQWLAKHDYFAEFFSYYFEKEGSNRNRHNTSSRAVNTLTIGEDRITPDGIAAFSTPRRRYLFLFEQHNGKDTKRAMRQLYGHVQALAEGSANEKYDYPHWVRVFYVFEHESSLKAVMERFRENPWIRGFDSHFLFKNTQELEQDFFSGWRRASGELESFT